MSSPHPEEVFSCECGGIYANRDSLLAHKRRHCRLRRSAEENNNTCTICRRKFRSYAGLRQHMRLSHTAEYNSALEVECNSSRVLWTEDEENYLAKLEAQYDGDDILGFLVSKSTRSRDAIRMKRRQRNYIEKVNVFKDLSQHQSHIGEEREEAEEEEEGIELELEQASRLNDIFIRDRELVEALSNIPSSNLADADITFKLLLTTISKEEVIAKFEEWFTRAFPSKPKSAPAGRNHITAGTDKNKRRGRAQAFRIAQEAFKNNRRTYARKLIDGSIDCESNVPPANDLQTMYSNVFEESSVEDNERIGDFYNQKHTVSYPISKEDLEEALKNTTVDTPGPDGITLSKVKLTSRSRLLLLFNTMMYLEYIPRSFRQSRTVLIPKTKTDLHLAKNWRPIAISSVLLRIYNRILAKRLMDIKICQSQRGFTRIDGCFANFATVDTIITHHRSTSKPLSIISLDVTKAFDTVSHRSIERAVRRLNVDGKAINIIIDNYKNLTTSVTCGGHSVGTYSVKRGVKQGDPMSPFLFNAVIDELLVQLQETFTGVKVGTSRVAALAYADDLVIFANTPEDGQRMLDHTIEFLAKRGLQLNASKCRSLVLKVVPGKKKIFIKTQPSFHVNEDTIPAIGIGDEFRYLGHNFNSEGISECTNEQLVEQLNRIQRAPLKPQQKFIIIKHHLIPKYIAVLQRPNVSAKVLQKVDRIIRSALKKILHLPAHCTNHLFYAPVKVGGLGIFQFSKLIPIITLNRWERLKESSELLNNTYQMSEPWILRYRRMIKDGMDSKILIHQHHEAELEKTMSGGGLKQVKNHSACVDFVRNPPKYWTGEDFIRAIHLRFNLLPSVGIPSNPPEQRKCRAGCNKVESLSHILQNCPLSHWWRITRHDYVVREVSTSAKQRGWKVLKEPHIRGTDGILKKPDLILEKEADVIVCDVAVHWEGPITLNTQYENKQGVYSTEGFVSKLKTLYPDKNIYIMPFIMGARGAYCHRNDAIAVKLKMTTSHIRRIVHTTMRGSWTTHRKYMQCVWRKPQHPTGSRRRLNN